MYKRQRQEYIKKKGACASPFRLSFDFVSFAEFLFDLFLRQRARTEEPVVAPVSYTHLDITLVGLADFARIAAQVAQFHERDHPRKKQQADDTQKTDRHSSAHTRHTSFDFINANIVN